LKSHVGADRWPHQPTDEEVAELMEISKKEGIAPDNLMGEVLKLGIEAHKKKHALDLYAEGKVTLTKAGEMCGFSVYDMLDEVRRLGLPISVYTEDLRAAVFESARSRAEYYRILEEWGKE